jgi:hypothetical protein
VSQGWPSWTFGLDGLGFNKISTIVSFPSLTSQDEFKATFLGLTLLEKSQLDDWIENHLEDGIIFVQGNCSFLDLTFKHVCGRLAIGVLFY